jgi:hypothetical protein
MIIEVDGIGMQISIDVHRNATLAQHLEAFRLALVAQSFTYVKEIRAINNDEGEYSSEDTLT